GRRTGRPHRPCPPAAAPPGRPCRPPRGRGRPGCGAASGWRPRPGPRPTGRRPPGRDRPPAPAGGPGRPRGRTGGRRSPSASLLRPEALRADRARLEVAQEAVHDAALARLVVQRLADDLAGQRGRDRTDLAPQLDHRLLALGLDLLVGGLGDAVRLGLRLLAHLGDDLGALLLGLLADAGGLGPGL